MDSPVSIQKYQITVIIFGATKEAPLDSVKWDLRIRTIHAVCRPRMKLSDHSIGIMSSANYLNV